MELLNNPIILGAIAVVAAIFLPKLGINVPWSPKPVDPNNPTPAPAPAPLPVSLEGLVEAIIKAVLARVLPQIQEVVKVEVANRPPVNAAVPVSVQANADGSAKIEGPGISVTTSAVAK